MYTFSEDGIIIRTMQVGDVSAYVSAFGYSIDSQKRLVLEVKKIIKNRKDDDPNLYFTVLKDGKIIGGIACEAFLDSPCDAGVKVDVPNISLEQEREIEKKFVKMAREYWFYDDIFFVIKQNGRFTSRVCNKIPISVKSRWETSE